MQQRVRPNHGLHTPVPSILGAVVEYVEFPVTASCTHQKRCALLFHLTQFFSMGFLVEHELEKDGFSRASMPGVFLIIVPQTPERVGSPLLVYPIASDLGQWDDMAGKERGRLDRLLELKQPSSTW